MCKVEKLDGNQAVETSADREGVVVHVEATECNVRILRDIREAFMDSSRKCQFWGKTADSREWRVHCHKHCNKHSPRENK